MNGCGHRENVDQKEDDLCCRRVVRRPGLGSWPCDTPAAHFRAQELPNCVVVWHASYAQRHPGNARRYVCTARGWCLR